MHERIEKIKTHFKQNKRTYISCAGTAVVAVVGTLIAIAALKDEDGDLSLSINDQDINQMLSWKPQAFQTIEVHIEALGDPGNIIQDDLTGNVYASQGQTADALGVSKSTVSKHLSGKTEHINGHKLTKLGKAMVSEV